MSEPLEKDLCEPHVDAFIAALPDHLMLRATRDDTNTMGDALRALTDGIVKSLKEKYHVE